MKRPIWVAAALAAGLLLSPLPATVAAANPAVANPAVAPAPAAQPAPAAAPRPNWKLTYEQVGQTTSVAVAVDPSIAAGATKLTLTATMNYGKTTTRKVTCTQPLPAPEGEDSTCDLKDYGKWSVTARFYKGKKKVRTNKPVSLGVVADEYIIAPLSGTLPGTMFTTSLWGENSIRGAGESQIPVIVRLTRAHQWDWGKLPAGVHAVPYLTKKQAAKRTTMNSYKAAAIAPIKAYLKDLRKLNKDSVFHLYVNDYTTHLVHNLLYANKIPEDRYTITFLSDGAFSYAQFAKIYAGADPAATHQKLVRQWETAKAKAYRNGKAYLSGTKGRQSFYAALQAEPSARWWLTRPALLNPKAETGTFAHAAQTNPQVVAVNVGTKLKELQGSGAQAVQEFKGVYKFNDAYFADAIKAKKRVMLFLGTRVDGVEQNFADYAGFAVKHYGKKYGYYYKGHPATPTEAYPAKQKELKKLGLIDVQASVPAELILFFNPDIAMSGYPSTTWASVPDINPEIAEGLFSVAKAAPKDAYYDGIVKWYMTPKPPTGPASKLPGDFLVEFSDPVAAEKGYDIAMWGSAKKTITYYKLVDGSYTKVT